MSNIDAHFWKQAGGAALLEVRLPHDERLLGGDPLADFRDTLQRAADRLGFDAGFREVDGGLDVAFRNQAECELVSTAMESEWNSQFLQRLNVAAATIFRDNPGNPKQAVQEFAEDYGLDYSDFADYIEDVFGHAQGEHTRARAAYMDFIRRETEGKHNVAVDPYRAMQTLAYLCIQDEEIADLFTMEL